MDELAKIDPLLSYRISKVAEIIGCKEWKVEALCVRGDLPAFSLSKSLHPSMLRVRATVAHANNHLAHVDIAPLLPRKKVPPRPQRTELSKAMSQAIKAQTPNLRRWYIYFAQGHEFVKIGYSESPRERLSSFRVTNPYPVQFIKVVDGWLEGERALHRLLEEYHHRGEWFRLEPELKKAILMLPGKRHKDV